MWKSNKINHHPKCFSYLNPALPPHSKIRSAFHVLIVPHRLSLEYVCHNSARDCSEIIQFRENICILLRLFLHYERRNLGKSGTDKMKFVRPPYHFNMLKNSNYPQPIRWTFHFPNFTSTRPYVCSVWGRKSSLSSSTQPHGGIKSRLILAHLILPESLNSSRFF